MSQKPLVSVITIFLNEEAHITEAIESVISQSYVRWELLLVDDGSTDGSSEIAREYARNYPDRISYLEHPGHQNRGMSASRNLGLMAASGSLIALLDADDVWLPRKLAVQQALLEDNPGAAMVYDASLEWHRWSGYRKAAGGDRMRALGKIPGTLVQPPTMIPLFLQGMAETPGTCSVLFRRRVTESIGGFEESFVGMFEDQVFFYKVCLRFPVLLAAGYTALYRQHPDSCCHVARRAGLYRPCGPSNSRRAFLCWLDGHLLEEGDAANSILPFLEAELWPYRHPVLHWLASRPNAIRARMKALGRHVAPAFVRAFSNCGSDGSDDESRLNLADELSQAGAAAPRSGTQVHSD